MATKIEVVERAEAPTTGHWLRGSVAINNAWTSGEVVYWICITSGEPGTWEPFYGSDGTETFTNKTLVGVAANLSTIAEGTSVTVAAGSQAAIFGSLTVNGTLTVAGEVRVCAWPS